MLMNTRPLKDNDLPRICAFPASPEELFFAFPKASFPLTLPWLRQALATRSDSTVVEHAGQVVGFANFYQWERGGRCSIGNVIVAPEARGHGVGRCLVTHMVELAISGYQAVEVSISCFNRNAAALLLYTKLGFRPYAVEEGLDWQGLRVALIRLLRQTGRSASEGNA